MNSEDLLNFTGQAPVNQNYIIYRPQHGVVSVLMDDDNCDCLRSLSLGHGIFWGGFDATYGTNNSLGVELLHDPGCHGPSPKTAWPGTLEVMTTFSYL